MTSHFSHQQQPPPYTLWKKSSAIFISLHKIFEFFAFFFFIFLKENPWNFHQKHSNQALLRSANELVGVEPSPGGSLQRASSLVLAALIMTLSHAPLTHSYPHAHTHSLTRWRYFFFCFHTLAHTHIYRAVISPVSMISIISCQGQCLKPEADWRPPSSFNQPFKMSLGYFNSSKVTSSQLNQRKREQKVKKNWEVTQRELRTGKANWKIQFCQEKKKVCSAL